MDCLLFTIKGETVLPKEHIKVLGIIIDTKLQYKQYIAKAATKGLEAVMNLKQFRGLCPSMARHLFTAIVVPVMDYVFNIWVYGCVDRTMKAINRVQNLGAQVIVGTFCRVATTVAEAKASILPAQEQFSQKATKLWIVLHLLPENNSL